MALDLPTVMGNHDQWLVDRPPAAMGAWERPVFPRLTGPMLDWLRALPMTREVEGLFLCHATPASNERLWLERLEGGQFVLAPHDAIEAEALGIDARVLLCGHSHTPRVVRLKDGRLVVNPGSVGCPGFADRRGPVPYVMSVGAPDARYAILERRSGLWRPELRAVPYEAASMVALAEATGEADWAAALSSGWVTL
jgi:diadenosine tetraphosphatase ApaH/serine/threonine PP2A family protein phosphatase